MKGAEHCSEDSSEGRLAVAMATKNAALRWDCSKDRGADQEEKTLKTLLTSQAS